MVTGILISVGILATGWILAALTTALWTLGPLSRRKRRRADREARERLCRYAEQEHYRRYGPHHGDPRVHK